MARKLTEAEQGGGGGGSGTSMCQFSERWLNNFKRRYGIQTEQQMPTKAEETEAEGEEDGRATAKMVEGKCGRVGGGELHILICKLTPPRFNSISVSK